MVRARINIREDAHFTQETALVKAFEQDEDIHRAVAAEVFNVPLEQVTREQRAYAKIIDQVNTLRRDQIIQER